MTKQEDHNKRSPVPHSYRGAYDVRKIQPNIINIAGLRKLYENLQEKTSTALNSYLATIKRTPDWNEKQFDAQKEEVKSVGRLTVMIRGGKKELIIDTNIEAFNEERLPDKITSITFDSSYSLERFNVKSPNRFRLHLNFEEPPRFHAYDPWQQSTPNNSELEVSGSDQIWVDGVVEYVEGFFSSRKTSRAWIHNQITFNIFNWLISFPASIFISYRIDSLFQAQLDNLHVSLRVSIYAYVVLLALLFFRMSAYGLRWMFPIVELEENQARNKKLKGVLGVILSGLFVGLLTDILKQFFW